VERKRVSFAGGWARALKVEHSVKPIHDVSAPSTPSYSESLPHRIL